MIDRELQGQLLRHMADQGGTTTLRPAQAADEEKYARNLMDLELQGLCKGGVGIRPTGLGITGETSLTPAGRAYLDRPDDLHVTLSGPETLKALRQRIVDDPDLSDTERHSLDRAVETMHPLALKALGQDLLARALRHDPDAIPLIRKHVGRP